MILYSVKASLKDNVIWEFRAIPAVSKNDAVKICKCAMKNIMMKLPRFKWTAASEWEDNLRVN